MVPVPLLTPKLSSRWLALVTSVDLQTARTLIESMSNEVIVTRPRPGAARRLGADTFRRRRCVRRSLSARR